MYTREQVLRIAAQAEVDPRTVERCVNGKAGVRPSSANRIQRAIKTLRIRKPKGAAK